jgi:hypothetical protein
MWVQRVAVAPCRHSWYLILSIRNSWVWFIESGSLCSYLYRWSHWTAGEWNRSRLHSWAILSSVVFWLDQECQELERSFPCSHSVSLFEGQSAHHPTSLRLAQCGSRDSPSLLRLRGEWGLQIGASKTLQHMNGTSPHLISLVGLVNQIYQDVIELLWDSSFWSPCFHYTLSKSRVFYPNWLASIWAKLAQTQESNARPPVLLQFRVSTRGELLIEVLRTRSPSIFRLLSAKYMLSLMHAQVSNIQLHNTWAFLHHSQTLAVNNPAVTTWITDQSKKITDATILTAIQISVETHSNFILFIFVFMQRFRIHWM